MVTMEYRTLGKTDLRVSRLSLGTLPFGTQVDENEAVRLVDCCLDRGINSFDTANAYGEGRAEAILGQALRGRRHQVVLASKVGARCGQEPDDAGLGRAALRKGINATLKRLGTDYLDLYYLHLPDRTTGIEETLRVMDELVQEGKVRYPAVSNFAAWQIVQMLWHSENFGYVPPTVAQQMYSLVTRGLEEEFLPCAREYGIGFVAYSPLAAGLLTGKHEFDRSSIAGTRFENNPLYEDRYWHTEFFEAVEDARGIGAESGLTVVELAFRWLLTQPCVDSIILGATNLEQLEENLDACGGPPLDAAVLARCDALWARLRGVTPRYSR
jgi:1-deoxyxylulose-5-phosphate synthase